MSRVWCVSLSRVESGFGGMVEEVVPRGSIASRPEESGAAWKIVRVSRYAGI
jgi:hypothetical protein